MAKTDSAISDLIASDGQDAAIEAIRSAFEAGGSIKAAAGLLGMAEGSLSYHMRALGLKIKTVRILVLERSGYTLTESGKEYLASQKAV